MGKRNSDRSPVSELTPGIALVRVEVEATPEARGQSAARFASMIEAIWSLGAVGAPELHGPEGACAFPDPGEKSLAGLLVQGVQTRPARRGG